MYNSWELKCAYERSRPVNVDLLLALMFVLFVGGVLALVPWRRRG